MHLLVDLGNTRLKWAVSAAEEWRSGAVAHRDRDVMELLGDVWNEMPAPTVVVMASVAAPTVGSAIEEWIGARWRLRVHHVKAQSKQLGVVNLYREPQTLGADRWAALIGARAELPTAGACVVDCGTAVTVDALSGEGEFVGGIIFPGLALLRDSLTRGTAGIRVAQGDATSCLARSTADAVAAGTVYGLTGAIERICREFEQELEQPLKLLVTGGDADQLAAHFTRPARRLPDLVLKGLECVAATL